MSSLNNTKFIIERRQIILQFLVFGLLTLSISLTLPHHSLLHIPCSIFTKYTHTFASMMEKVNDIYASALRTIQLESASIAHLETFIDKAFEAVVLKLSACAGRIVVSGVGKSAIIAQKIAATFNSTGTPSIFMHAADAVHGDAGMMLENDIIILISKSGESAEVKALVPLIKNNGNFLVGMVGNTSSYLAKAADGIINTSIMQEACPNNLAPTSSTTAQMVMGDVLAICLMELKGFNSNDFAKFHPGGALGKQLYLKVSDIYLHNEKPVVQANASLKEIIVEITKKRMGAAAVVNNNNHVIGIITDGDLRRMLEKNKPFETLTAQDIASIAPKTIVADALAVEAFDIMRTNDISQLIVVQNNEYVGMIHLHDLIREGIMN